MQVARSLPCDLFIGFAIDERSHPCCTSFQENQQSDRTPIR
ncbi:hypothetical protein [Tolypothrix bouteillei]